MSFEFTLDIFFRVSKLIFIISKEHYSLLFALTFGYLIILLCFFFEVFSVIMKNKSISTTCKNFNNDPSKAPKYFYKSLYD